MVVLLFRSQTDTWDQAIDNVSKVGNRQVTETPSVNLNFQDMVAHLLYAPASIEKECVPISDRWKAGGLSEQTSKLVTNVFAWESTKLGNQEDTYHNGVYIDIVV